MPIGKYPRASDGKEPRNIDGKVPRGTTAAAQTCFCGTCPWCDCEARQYLMTFANVQICTNVASRTGPGFTWEPVAGTFSGSFITPRIANSGSGESLQCRWESALATWSLGGKFSTTVDPIGVISRIYVSGTTGINRVIQMGLIVVFTNSPSVLGATIFNRSVGVSPSTRPCIPETTQTNGLTCAGTDVTQSGHSGTLIISPYIP